MKKIALLILLCAPLAAFAASVSNAGFLESSLWYSKDPFFAGETVRIYAALFNSGQDDISGTVEFFDNKQLIGTRDFFIGRGGAFAQVFTDWNVAAGAHAVEAVITKASRLPVGEAPVSIEFERTKVQEDSRTVDEDTDKDEVGNSADTDDDNDGASDAEEIKNGTNPLTYDAPLRKEKQVKTTPPPPEPEKENPPGSTLTDKAISLLPEAVEEDIARGNAVVRETLAPINNFLEKTIDKKEAALRVAAPDPDVAGREKLKGSLYLASLGAASFVLKNEIILYLAALVIGFFAARAAFRRMFKRP